MKNSIIRMVRGFLLASAACAIVVCQVATYANETKDSSQVIDSFLTHVSKADLSDEVKAKVKQVVGDLRDDPYTQADAITQGLAAVYPEYASAVESTQGDDLEGSITSLEPHTKSDDKFLAADASFFVARALLNLERFEDALPILETLTGDLADYSVHSGSSQYFMGVAQANLLRNKEAIASFQTFLEQNTDAPERMQVSAWRQIQQLNSIREGELVDIHQRMDFSRRRLELEKTGNITQEQHRKIVNMLAKMIKEQEKKECSNCKSKCKGNNTKDGQAKKPGKPGGNKKQGKSSKGGTSNNPNGTVRREYGTGPASPWSKLRDRARDPAYSAIKEQMPARYREIVERYTEKAQGNESEDTSDN